MKLAIGRNELLKGVQSVIGAAAGKKGLEILKFLHCQSDGQTLSLMATDLETTLVYRLEHYSEPFTTLLPAKRLHDVLRSFSDGSVVGLEEKDGKTTLKCGRSRFVLATMNPLDYPILKESDADYSFTLDQALLLSMMGITDYAVAKKDVRYYLCGLMIEMSEGLTVVATDGHRLAKAHAQIKVPTDRENTIQVIIPADAAGELKKLLNDTEECELSFTKNQFRVDMDECTFVTKLIDGRFPDYHRVIPRDPKIIIPIKREAFIGALSRVRLVLTEENRGVELIFDQNSLTLKAKSSTEDAEEVLDIEYSGKESHIGFNYKYLLESLQAMQSETVLLKLTDEYTGLVMEGMEQEDGLHVVMNMRL